MARVIANQRGHDGSQIREVGEVFDVPDERLEDGSDWFDPVDGVRPKPKAANARPPGAGPAKQTAANTPGAPAPGAPNPAKASAAIGAGTVEGNGDASTDVKTEESAK